MSISLGFNTAVRALITQQQALNTTAHNVANANTPGFSRQDVNLATTDPFTFPSQNRAAMAGQVGTGVAITDVRRIRDIFLDVQYRLQNQGLGMQETIAQGIHNIEDFYNEPTDQGLGQQLSKFWNQWRDVTNDPRNQATRITLKETALDLTAFIRRVFSQLATEQRHLDEQVVGKVTQINSITQQIGSLNDQIAKVLAVGDTPNDLRDRRDLLLDQLSKMTRVSAFENDRGMEMITLGGVQMVGENFVNQIKLTRNSNGFNDLFWTSDNSAVTVTGGETRGLLDLRDITIPDQLARLNDLARTLVSAVNNQHKLGSTLTGAAGADFFSTGTVTLGDIVKGASFSAAGNPITVSSVDVSRAKPATYTLSSPGAGLLRMTRSTDAAVSGNYTVTTLAANGTEAATFTFTDGSSVSFVISSVLGTTAADIVTDLTGKTLITGQEASTIDVAALIQTDVNSIAAAGTGVLNAPGDSTNSDAIASLQFALMMTSGTATVEDFYRGLISTLGGKGQGAENQASNQNLLVQHIEKSRQTISGVSLDEEATKQIEFQRGFEAAARLVSVFDSMLDTIINQMVHF